MNYDIEQKKRESSAIRQAFAECFPLVDERDLPSAAVHIRNFLCSRIRHEVELGTRHFTSRVVRVLCEISPPKNYVEDMARIVVNKAKEAEQLADKVKALQAELQAVRAELGDLKKQHLNLSQPGGQTHGDEDRGQTTEATAHQAGGSEDGGQGAVSDQGDDGGQE